MAQFLYSGPSGDQYEAWKKEHLAKEAEEAKAAEVAKEVEAEVVEEAVQAEVKAKLAPKK